MEPIPDFCVCGRGHRAEKLAQPRTQGDRLAHCKSTLPQCLDSLPLWAPLLQQQVPSHCCQPPMVMLFGSNLWPFQYVFLRFLKIFPLCHSFQVNRILHFKVLTLILYMHVICVHTGLLYQSLPYAFRQELTEPGAKLVASNATDLSVHPIYHSYRCLGSPNLGPLTCFYIQQVVLSTEPSPAPLF